MSYDVVSLLLKIYRTRLSDLQSVLDIQWENAFKTIDVVKTNWRTLRGCEFRVFYHFASIKWTVLAT